MKPVFPHVSAGSATDSAVYPATCNLQPGTFLGEWILDKKAFRKGEKVLGKKVQKVRGKKGAEAHPKGKGAEQKVRHLFAKKR